MVAPWQVAIVLGVWAVTGTPICYILYRDWKRRY